MAAGQEAGSADREPDVARHSAEHGAGGLEAVRPAAE